VFPWLEKTKALFQLKLSKSNEDKLTAQCFLDFMEQLSTVVIQDAAAMSVLHPERMSHPLFNLPLFQSEPFKMFERSMRVSLGQSQHPFAADLETVIPGLNERLNALAYNSVIISQKIDLMHQETVIVHQQVTQLLNAVQNSLGTSGLAHHAAHTFLNRAPIMVGAPDSSPPQPVTSPTNNKVQEECQVQAAPAPQAALNHMIDGFNHVMKCKYTSATEIYHEWHGIGPFEGIPITGGIKAMEVFHKHNWRYKFNTAQKQAFSRIQRIMKALNHLHSAGRPMDDILLEFDRIFKGEARKSLSNFVSILQRRGYLDQRSRKVQRNVTQED
jgi:hypothetical protein